MVCRQLEGVTGLWEYVGGSVSKFKVFREWPCTWLRAGAWAALQTLGFQAGRGAGCQPYLVLPCLSAQLPSSCIGTLLPKPHKPVPSPCS